MINWDDISNGKSSGQFKTTCPSCIEDRTNKRDKSLSVSNDKGLANCHYCNDFSIRDFKEKESFKMPDQSWQNYTSLSDQMVKYFAGRGISQKTLIECRVTEETYYQPAKQANVNNIVFNYFEGERLVNKKYRSAAKDFTQSAGTKNIFYGINDVIGAKEIYLVEGEIDKLSFWEIGIKNVISVPNGANDNDDVWKNCEKYLSDCEKFIIASDCDEKGDALSEKIAQRLGRYRCERVAFKGKDANEDLTESQLTLEESIKSAKRYPVSGTFTVDDLWEDTMSLYENGLPETIYPTSPWFKGLESFFSVMRGHLVVGTGIPSHGKSNMTDWYVLNLLQDHNMKGSWLSPEHNPMSLHLSNMISKTSGERFFKSDGKTPRISKSSLKDFRQWSKEKIYLTAPDKNDTPTWNWVFDTFKQQMYTYGVDVFVIDAFNKIKLNGKGDRKDQIDDILTDLTSFAQRNNVIVFLIAHPTKMRKNEKGIYDSPTLYDVSGSADFRNQTHDGFGVYRYWEDEESGQENETEFTNLKTKFSFQGNIGESKKMVYHMDSGRYYMKGTNYNPRPIWSQDETPITNTIDDFENSNTSQIFTNAEDPEIGDIPF